MTCIVCFGASKSKKFDSDGSVCMQNSLEGEVYVCLVCVCLFVCCVGHNIISTVTSRSLSECTSTQYGIVPGIWMA